MHTEEWSAARVAAALARLEDAGYAQPKMARLAGVSQSTVNRWRRGKVQPGYATVRRLAAATWRRHPELARELVEASGYAWAEPADEPEPPDVLAGVWGPDVADSVRREVRKRAPQDAEKILEAIEDDLRRPSSAGESERGRAAG
jgi:transcriptional regulator with XRE-family HTH domain